jgi:hypothetical protein
MQAIGIILMCILAAVVYGIIHDQITARICVEYFTVGHPPVFDTDDPTLLGLGWGIIATWWVGLMLGVPLAIVARVGAQPKRSASSLLRPIVTLLAVMACCAMAFGTLGWFFAEIGAVILRGRIALDVPESQHVPFIADLWAHLASYFFGFLGGIVVIISVWRARGRAAAADSLG